ncbi:hypothetical protein [Rhodohalobacter sp.]|uniref:hypothetical protein n=1 Tax=Rhodohalobacter sp. TaxID=1974210 RepID=UPI002ACE5C3C|nr:hypothetical protein [Rhodohalobacter sp.]MDZ7757687.1 hypothetical protein [Rhodohalobacter sp.]
MNVLKPFLLLMSLLIVMGCASTEPRTESSKFEFQFEEQTYEIIGLVSPDGESLNDLVLRDGREIVFWARDQNQDGAMDRVMRGDISLERANEIYKAGIRLAAEQGKYEQKPHPRTFEFVDEQYIYTLVTVMGDSESSYNLFSVYNIETEVETKMRDSNHNGRLDENQFESEEYIRWQRLYKRALEKGVNERRVQMTDEGTYIVLVDRRLTSQ